MCAAWVVHDGERLRRRTDIERGRYHERGGRCPYACSPGACALEEGPTPAAEAALTTWARCGGVQRFCWPRSGGALDQDAVTVYQFEAIDAAIAEERRKRGADEGRNPPPQA